ncbi:MAG: cation transporter [Hyphomicrobiaceae bacterium]|nr:cation transporter [Hyphomicrobiaceae bacterium]
MTTADRLATGSLIVGIAILLLKLGAWWVTGSVALLSDALESTVNVVAAVAVLIAVRVAARPADHNHPFGHYKAEYFAAVLEGAMVAVAALLIVQAAVVALVQPHSLEAPVLGIGLNLLAAALNAAWAFILIGQGGKLGSPALVADGRHIFADVLTSVGVVIGLVLAIWTGWSVLDPLLALIVGMAVLKTGWDILQSSFSGLMDEAVSDDEQQTIQDLIKQNAEGAIEAHDIRTRRAGPAIFVEFHLVVDGKISVEASHEICDRIEAALRRKLTPIQVVIHVEPAYKAKHEGVLLDVPVGVPPDLS